MNALTHIGAPRIQALVPQTMEQVFQLAHEVHKSGLAPQGLNTPQAIAVAILHGLELGVPPMTALQKIAVINGRPTIWGDLALALVRNSGLLESFKEEITGAGDARAAVCTVKRKGDADPIVGRFSVADAKRAGLWDERARVQRKNRQTVATYEAPNDSPWHRFPDRMLKFRARGFTLRDSFADVLGGMYLREEIDEEPQVEVIAAPVPPRPAAAKALTPPNPTQSVPFDVDAARAPVGHSDAERQNAPRPPSPHPSRQGAHAREERAHQPAGSDLFGTAPAGATDDFLEDLENRFALATTEKILQSMYAAAEGDIVTAPLADQQQAAQLYQRHLARIQRGAK